MAKRPIGAAVAAGLAAADRLDADAEIARLRAEVSSVRGRYKAALAALDAEKARAATLAGLQNMGGKKFRKRTTVRSRTTATAIAVLSDWHVEETVSFEQTSGANRFDLETADKRIDELAERLSTLIEHERRLVKIDRIVLACLGDFISGHIHEELAETTSLAPMEAMRWAAKRIRGLIDMAADMAHEVVVVTQPGNHGRSNHGKPRMATEHQHSFEQNAYLMMREAETRKNVTWQIAEGYLGYIDLDGFTVRYHHGHSIGRYQGGIGGITIPANKAIAAWNRSRRADIDLFGHWHQWGWLRGRYVSNGSLVGMNAFALRIRAEAEAPCQSLVIVDGGRKECTKAMPVWCDRDLKERK